MQIETTAQTITKLLNKGDKKSLGSLLLFIHDRWIEEQHYELFSDYQKYVKNVLRKYTPKRTKFISFTNDITPENTIALSLTIRLVGSVNETKISVSKGTLNWCECSS
jgi:hypothetical protein